MDACTPVPGGSTKRLLSSTGTPAVPHLRTLPPTLESALSEESCIPPEGVLWRAEKRLSVACVHLLCARDITLVVTIWIQACI